MVFLVALHLPPAIGLVFVQILRGRRDEFRALDPEMVETTAHRFALRGMLIPGEVRDHRREAARPSEPGPVGKLLDAFGELCAALS